MFKEHLNKSNTSYFNHMKFAVINGIFMILFGITSIIHGVIPFMFDGWAAKYVIKLYHRHLLKHPNKEYEDYILEHLEN